MSIEVFFAGDCFVLGVANYAITMFWRGIDCVQSEIGAFRSVNHVMPCARRNYDAVPILNLVFYTVDGHFSVTAFKPEKLIMIFVDFFPYFFSRLEAH